MWFVPLGTEDPRAVARSVERLPQAASAQLADTGTGGREMGTPAPAQPPQQTKTGDASPPRWGALLVGGAILLVTALLGVVLVRAQLSGGGLPQNPVGAPAPDLRLPTLEGEEVRVSELSDGPLLLTFWASWCATCSSNMPLLDRLSRDWADRGVRVAGVVIDDLHADAVAAAAQHGNPYPSLFDGGGDASAAFTVAGIPETFLIDVDGTITAKWFGPLPEHDVELKLALTAQ
jgi:cytochrome c biogenesis protein CcmG, thiol:disulfide interchange protein DsbE